MVLRFARLGLLCASFLTESSVDSKWLLGANKAKFFLYAVSCSPSNVVGKQTPQCFWEKRQTVFVLLKNTQHPNLNPQ